MNIFGFLRPRPVKFPRVRDVPMWKITYRKAPTMDPVTISAILTVSLKVLDYLDSRAGAESGAGLDEEMLEARKVLRKALIEQAKS